MTIPSAIGVIDGDIEIVAVCENDAQNDQVEDNVQGAIEPDEKDDTVLERRLLRDGDNENSNEADEDTVLDSDDVVPDAVKLKLADEVPEPVPV